MKRLSISIALAAVVLSGGCRVLDVFNRLSNIPEHCSVRNVDDGSWASLIGECSFDNPLEALTTAP